MYCLTPLSDTTVFLFNSSTRFVVTLSGAREEYDKNSHSDLEGGEKKREGVWQRIGLNRARSHSNQASGVSVETQDTAEQEDMNDG